MSGVDKAFAERLIGLVRLAADLERPSSRTVSVALSGGMSRPTNEERARLLLLLAAGSLVDARLVVDELGDPPHAGDMLELKRHTAALESHAQALRELVDRWEVEA